MDKGLIETVGLIAAAGIKAGCDALTIMATRGLVSPAEVDRYADGITVHLRRADADPRAELYGKLAGMIDGLTEDSLAAAKRAARDNWKGARPDD